jgi:hypothetical protein
MIGKRNFIITTSDVSGNKAFDTIQIEILDTIKPILNVWNDTVFQRCDIPVPTFSATDNCSVSEFKKISGPDVGTNFPLGTSILVYQAKDASGNITTDSLKVTVNQPLHYKIDSFYFDYCKGDTLFTILSIKNDLINPFYFVYKMDTIKILKDSQFVIQTTVDDSLYFQIYEASTCNLDFEQDIIYPGPPLILDSVKVTDATELLGGQINVFIQGKYDSIAWYDIKTNTFVNHDGKNLSEGNYLLKVYSGPCEFSYGPYEVRKVVSTSELNIVQLNVFPVPFKNELQINTDYKYNLNYVIMNAQGLKISEGQFNHKVIVDVTNLNSGIYFLRCYDAESSGIVKLIKI